LVTPDNFFSESFDSAKYKFISYINKLNNWDIEDINNDTTIATYKHPTSKRWIIITSGIHGVEGYTGSAIQCSILDYIKCYNDTIEIKHNIMLIHAINPFGMKYYQRNNSNNVDLNRNCIIDSQIFENKINQMEQPFIVDKLINPINYLEYYLMPIFFIFALLIYGLGYCTRAVVSGQYKNQLNMFFGGNYYQDEIKNLFSTIGKYFNNESEIIHVDIHTGYGKYLNEYIMVDTRNDKDKIEKIIGYKQFYVNNEQEHYKYQKGSLVSGFVYLLNEYSDCKIEIENYTGMIQEFGTVNYNNIPIFFALRKNNFLRRIRPYQINIDKNIYELFNPKTLEYQINAISSGTKLAINLISKN